MRFRARLVLGLYGVALAVPAVVMAGPLGDDDNGQMDMAPPQAQAEPHHHKGLFGRRHCVECQRAYVKAHDGVDVPAPPPLEPGMQGAGRQRWGLLPDLPGKHGRVRAGARATISTRLDMRSSAGPADLKRPAMPSSVRRWRDPSQSPSASPSCALTARRILVWPQWVDAPGPDPSIHRSFRPICRRRRPPSRHRLPIGRTSSAICSVCRCSARTDASARTRNAKSTPRSLTARASTPVTELPASVVYGKGSR